MLKSILNNLIFITVKAWQKAGPLKLALGIPQCRFYPSCSEYFLESITTQGYIKGFVLFIKRLIRCNPLCEGGIDNVPSCKAVEL